MKSGNEVKAGAFIVIALAMLTVTIAVMGRERQIFADQDTFYTSFTDVKGLNVGAPIRLGGITVGRVAKIGFTANEVDPTVQVTMLINREYLNRLTADASVSLDTQGLLGDRFLTIMPGHDKNMIKAGASIQSVDTPEIAQALTKAQVIIDNASKISESVQQLLAKFNKETMDDLTKTVKSAGEIAEEIEKGDGALHRLIYSKKDGDSIVGTLEKAAGDIREVTNEMKTGKGLLNALVYDASGANTIKALNTTADKLSATMVHVADIAEQIKSGNGVMHDMIYTKSKESLDDVVRKLNETAENLRKASEALATGSGTIGALLLDPQLYDNLVEVTDGAKRSFLLRQAIKSSLQKSK